MVECRGDPRNLSNFETEKWRRRESNVGPATSQESAGASRSTVSGEESVVCGDEGRAASAVENGGECRSCSNVANPPTPAELLALVDAAIVALDAGEIEGARARLHALARAFRFQTSSRAAKEGGV